jgi:hypothetical protein
MRDRIGMLRDDALEWCRGRHWQWRVPLLALLAYVGWRELTDPDYAGLFAGITFGIHELGHLVFAFLGEWMMFAGGSLAQLLGPVGVMALMLRQRDYFGAAVGGVWLSTSLVDLATYIGDAQARELELLGMGGEPTHDWAWLLESMGLIAHDTAIASGVRALALLVLAAAVALGGWLCLTMARTPPEPEAAAS